MALTKTTVSMIEASGTASPTTFLRGDGSWQVASTGGDYILRSYTSPATWTKPAGLKAVKVTVQGAGGSAVTAGGNTACSGGGSGGTAIYYAQASSIPSPQPITAGAGTNSFGAIASATAGANGAANVQNNVMNGGAGGTASGGTININGNSGGMSSTNPTATIAFSGAGAPSVLGTGGASVFCAPLAGVLAGFNASGYGAGGSGGASRSAPTPAAGGSGTAGIVIIEEFY